MCRYIQQHFLCHCPTEPLLMREVPCPDRIERYPTHTSQWMLAESLENEIPKCWPRSPNTRHDYIQDDCEGCRLRKELNARNGRLSNYLERHKRNANVDATSQIQQQSTQPTKQTNLQEDFVLYTDAEEKEGPNPPAECKLMVENPVETEEIIILSYEQALRIIESGELVLEQEECDRSRKRASTPGLEET